MASLNNLQTGVKGTAKEIQEFVASLKGRSPAEAMGVVAQSHLLQAIILSMAIQGAIMGASCVYGYITRDRTPPKSETTTVVTTPPATKPATSTAVTPPANVTPAATTTNAGPSEDAIKKVMNTEVVKPEDQKQKGPRDVEDLLNNSR